MPRTDEEGPVVLAGGASRISVAMAATIIAVDMATSIPTGTQICSRKFDSIARFFPLIRRPTKGRRTADPDFAVP